MKDLDPHTHTEYSGKVGHEKKLRQTHWLVEKKLRLRKTRPDTHEWVRIGEGRYKLVKRSKQ